MEGRQRRTQLASIERVGIQFGVQASPRCQLQTNTRADQKVEKERKEIMKSIKMLLESKLE
jgi:hypothetical protein